MKQWLIYKHTSMKSGKSYVGMTSQTMETRWKQHISAAKHGDSKYFARAISLYGEDNWDHEVLVENIDTFEEACALEKYYIKKLDTFENGYNLTIGGGGVSIELPNFIFYNPELGKIEECTLPELSLKYDLHQGYLRYVTQDKAKHTNGWFLWKGSNADYFIDPIYSFEHKEHGVITDTLKNIAEKYGVSKGNLCMVAKGQRNYAKGWTLVGSQEELTKERVPGTAKPIVKVDIITQEIVAEYPSICHAARENNLSESVVGDRCRGRVISSIGNFTYKYKGE